MFFFAFCSFETKYLIQGVFSRAQANAGQRRPTAANDGQRRPTQANAGRGTRFSLSNVCFFSRFVPLKLTILYQFYLAGRRPTQADEGPQQPMMANEGQCRPTKTKRGPNDASGVVWAIICFFSNVQYICYFFITSPSTYSCFFSNKPRSEPEPGLGPLLGPGSILFEA